MKRIKCLGLIMGILCISMNINAQKYFSKTGKISFYSHTIIEEIEALSNTATTVYDSESGNIQWAVLVKSFEFEKALMQEHFNENYMESSKYPKAIFKGTIKNNSDVDLENEGIYKVDVIGELTIHGVTKSIETNAFFEVKSGVISAHSAFNVLVAEYGIEIPAVVRENIAKEIEIKIECIYEVLDK